MLMHESRVFELRIKTKFQVCALCSFFHTTHVTIRKAIVDCQPANDGYRFISRPRYYISSVKNKKKKNKNKKLPRSQTLNFVCRISLKRINCGQDVSSRLDRVVTILQNLFPHLATLLRVREVYFCCKNLEMTSVSTVPKQVLPNTPYVANIEERRGT